MDEDRFYAGRLRLWRSRQKAVEMIKYSEKLKHEGEAVQALRRQGGVVPIGDPQKKLIQVGKA